MTAVLALSSVFLAGLAAGLVLGPQLRRWHVQRRASEPPPVAEPVPQPGSFLWQLQQFQDAMVHTLYGEQPTDREDKR